MYQNIGYCTRNEEKYTCERKKGDCEVWVTDSRALISVSPPYHPLFLQKKVAMFFVLVYFRVA